MDLAVVLLVWAGIVIASMAVIAYLAPRWGHDPFGWVLLAAVMGPIAIVGLVGTRQSNARRPEPFEVAPGAAAVGAGERVLLACDGSEPSVRAARYVADTHRDSAQAIVLSVLPHEARPSPDGPALEEHRRQIEEITGETLRVLRDAGIPATVVVGYGSAGEEIARCADERGVDVIAIGRRGKGLSKALLGSVSDHVVKHAKRPVVVVD